MTAAALWTKHRPLARRLSRDFRIPGNEPQDTEQEALVALWEAARGYDAGKGARFPTWATLVIRRRLTDLLRTATREKRGGVTVELEDVAAPDRGEGPEQLRLTVAALPALSAFERASLARTLNGRPMTARASRAANRARNKLRPALLTTQGGAA